MSDDVQNWTWLSPVGMILIVMGMVMNIGATWISYRFFNQNSAVKYVLKFVGMVVAVIGFMLAAEMYRV